MTALTQNKSIQIFMLQVGFEPMIPVFQRAKTVHALDRGASAIGLVAVYGDITDAYSDNNILINPQQIKSTVSCLRNCLQGICIVKMALRM
jgi:hypothetical protein